MANYFSGACLSKRLAVFGVVGLLGVVSASSANAGTQWISDSKHPVASFVAQYASALTTPDFRRFSALFVPESRARLREDSFQNAATDRTRDGRPVFREVTYVKHRQVDNGFIVDVSVSLERGSLTNTYVKSFYLTSAMSAKYDVAFAAHPGTMVYNAICNLTSDVPHVADMQAKYLVSQGVSMHGYDSEASPEEKSTAAQKIKTWFLNAGYDKTDPKLPFSETDIAYIDGYLKKLWETKEEKR